MLTNILIVDDNLKHCTAVKEYINQLANCSIAGIVYDGNECINFLHNEHITPDIVLLDIEMKRLNGLTTLLYIKLFFPLIKVIVLSSHCENEVIEDVFAEGADAFIWKHKLQQQPYLTIAIQKVLSNEYYWDERLVEYNNTNLQAP